MTDSPKPAYFIVNIHVKNYEDYMARYAMPLAEIFQRDGIEVVALSPAPTVLEGSWEGNWTVVIRFASREQARAFYDSEEYRPLKELRIGQLTEGGSVVLVDGFDPSSFALP